MKNAYIDVQTDLDQFGFFFYTRFIYNNKRRYIFDEESEEFEKYAFNSYEEALEAGIKKALEMILEKGE